MMAVEAVVKEKKRKRSSSCSSKGKSAKDKGNEKKETQRELKHSFVFLFTSRRATTLSPIARASCPLLQRLCVDRCLAFIVSHESTLSTCYKKSNK